MVARLVICFFLLSGLAIAQTDFEEALARWSSSAAPGFSLQLERMGDAVLYEGQLVAIRVLYETPYSQQWDAPPPPVRYQFAGFLLDRPVDGCGTEAQPCLIAGAGIDGYDALLRIGSFTLRPVETDLNTYLPPMPTGSYRAAVIMRRTALRTGGGQIIYVNSDPPAYLVSNAIEFRLEPASEEWVRETIQAARETLQAALSWDSESQWAARQIAAIDHPEARVAALELFRFPHQREILLGLTRNTPAREACDLMQERLAAPEQPLHLEYATVMGEVCAKADHPFPEELSAAPSDDPRMREWSQAFQAHESQVQREVMAVVAARAAGGADAEAMRREVLRYGSEVLNNAERSQDVPEFVRQIVLQVVQGLPQSSQSEITSALQAHWPLVREANPEAALRSIIGSHLGPSMYDSEGHYAPSWVDARELAIRRFHELNPAVGRMILLDELKQFRPTIHRLTDLLPREAVPPMDDALLDSFQKEPYERWFSSFLIAHYLSPRGAERLKQMIGPRWNECHSEWLAYFTRADPAYAERILKRTPWDMHQPVAHCGVHWMYTVSPFGVHRVFEEYLIAHLQHEGVPVKWTAAAALSAYGSANARKPLEEAFRYFHDYWMDRKAELEDLGYREGRLLEQRLRAAIAQGRAWFVDEAALRQLAALCVSDICRTETLEDAAQWEQRPLRIEIRPGAGALESWQPADQYGWQGEVAHYRKLDGIEGVKRKLSQFPRGTEFTLQVFGSPSDRQRITAELSQFAGEAGFVLQ